MDQEPCDISDANQSKGSSKQAIDICADDAHQGWQAGLLEAPREKPERDVLLDG